MPSSFSSAVATVFEDVLTSPQNLSKCSSQPDHYQKHAYPSPDSPRLVHRISPSRSSTQRSRLSLRHLIRRRWSSLSKSAPVLDDQKAQDLKRLGKCVNSNASTDDAAVAAALRDALDRCTLVEYRSSLGTMTGRRMSEHLYQVDELPAETDSAERESLESSGTTIESSSGCTTPTSTGTSFEQQRVMSKATESYDAQMHQNSPSSRRWSAPFRTSVSPQRPASHSFAFAQRRRPSLSTPRSLSFANGPPPSTATWQSKPPDDTLSLAFALSPSRAAGGRMHFSAMATSDYPFPPPAQYHARTRSLPPHLGGVSGQLRTPQKMKKRSS
ncbi:hypothetical protein CFIMG_008456RA00001 [Ceratocystis fimbriata CBS 114723]|uniref:Uncharacterized protein n=1 Tax=Ceratocystis fimbriata CBS 114723 TaxID=1035309 RepID=A0A2C5X2E2_9PEZI|nr:hypothetical protein CFIMG_008456RA00001 [Ceratocystis fimbriata CBS 114723]